MIRIGARSFRRGAGLLALTLLAACAEVPVSEPAVPPIPSAIQAPQLNVTAASARGRSDESRSLSLFYARLEQRLLDVGLMRRGVDPADAPVTAASLARNFERIALFSEYTQVGERYVAKQSKSTLRRWERPIRMQLHFGATVPANVRSADATRIRAYVGRLRRATGHPMSVVGSGGNFHVFIASVDEQRALGPRIKAAEPALSSGTIREITGLGRNIYCAVYASSTSDNPGAYVSAVAFVRAEHPDLFRQSCFHEEIAQGLGLANDSPEVRPSIFNDDEEFALLTRHDELLLKMLYDRRLRIGMTAEEARPVVAQIAAELGRPTGPS